jgi:hypothetical protein
MVVSILIIVFILSQYGFSQDNRKHRIFETLKCSQGKYKMYDLKIKILDHKDLPYNNNKKRLKKEEYYDDSSIPLHNYKGKLNYHPVFLAGHTHDLFNNF